MRSPDLNTRKSALIAIKEAVLEGVTLHGVTPVQILLFGSRSRGDEDQYSDYDILVVVKEDIEPQIERLISRHIRRILAKKLIPVDVLVRSEKHVQHYKNAIGSVIKLALEEGVPIG